MDTLTIILNLMKLQNCDNQVLATALGLNRQVVTDWKAGRSKSYSKYLPQIADYFGVSVDYLLGKTNTPESPKTALSPNKQKIVDMCDSLSAEDLQKVIEYTEFIIAKKER